MGLQGFGRKAICGVQVFEGFGFGVLFQMLWLGLVSKHFWISKLGKGFRDTEWGNLDKVGEIPNPYVEPDLMAKNSAYEA